MPTLFTLKWVEIESTTVRSLKSEKTGKQGIRAPNVDGKTPKILIF